MEPSISHIHVINNCPGQYNTNSNFLFLCFDLSFIKFLMNTRTVWSRTETSDLLAFGYPTEP